jgi:orotate phosphoribosyltransferase-like protein
MKIPVAQHHIHLEELARLIAKGLSDKDIMQELNLKRRTYYYRKAQVSKIYGNIAEKKTEETLEAEAHILKDRFLHLYRMLYENIATANNRNTRLKDIATAAQVAADIAIQVLRLEVEGFRTRQAKQAEARAAKYV